MPTLPEEPDAAPYWSEQYPVGRFMVRITKGKNIFLRFQAGYNRVEERCYACKAMTGRGFHENVVVFHLLGYGETERDALAMAMNRTK